MKTKRQTMNKPFSLKELGRKALTVLLTISMVSMNTPYAYAVEELMEPESATVVDEGVVGEDTEATEQEQAEVEEPTASEPIAEIVDTSAIEAASEVEVRISFDHAYIHYMNQAIASPVSTLTLPTNEDFVFAAAADEGYDLTDVKVVIGDDETVLVPNSDGLYTVPQGMLTTNTKLIVKAEGVAIESTEGTSVLSEERNTQETFTYEDDDIKVTATLADPSILPAGVEFKVTPVTAQTEGYSYDAYLEALNEGVTDEADEYTDDNTIMYDVAFLVTNDKGEVEEVEPEAGSVTVNFDFKNKQLSDGLDVQNAEDLEVTHLTVDESVMTDAATTQDATEVKASDIVVETLETSVDVNSEVAEFTTDSFSIFIFRSGSTQQKTWAGTNAITQNTIYSVLGVNNLDDFAVVANELDSTDHIEGNIRVGTFTFTGQSANLNQADNFQKYNTVNSIVIRKTVKNGKDGTFKFAFFDANSNQVGNVYSITTSGKAGELVIANDGSDVFSKLASGTHLYLYELDANGKPVKQGQKNGNYTVGYVYDGGSAAIANSNLDIYIGEFNAYNPCWSGGVGGIEPKNLWSTGNGTPGVDFNIYVGEEPRAQNNSIYFGSHEDFYLMNTSDISPYIYVPGLKDIIASDLDRVATLSSALANAKNGDTATTGTNVNVINLVSSSGNLENDLREAGFLVTSEGDKKSVIDGMLASGEPLLINIAVDPSTDTYVLNGQSVYYDGANPQHDNGYSNLGGLLIYNFVTKNSDGSFSPYTGTVKIQGWTTGMILAPQGTIDQSEGEYPGELIGNKVIHRGQEIHKKTTSTNKGRDIEIEVTNTGEEEEERKGEIELQATKAINTWPAGKSFEFKLYDADGKELDAATATDTDRTVTFKKIEYTEAGTYNYTIQETVPDDAVDADGNKYANATNKNAGEWTLEGITYDATPIAVTVEVTNSETAGQLDTAATYSPSDHTITNKYAATGSVDIEAKKILKGRDWKDGEVFTFVLSDGNLKANVTKTTDATTHIATFDHNEINALNFTSEDVGKTYTYTLKEQVPTGETKGLTYDKSEYTIDVTVEKDNGDGTLQVNKVVKKNDTEVDAISFTNEYEATGEFELSGNKMIEGREFREGDKLKFTVSAVELDADGNEVADSNPSLPNPASVEIEPTSGTSADVKFNKVAYTMADAGKTYRYTVTEEVLSGGSQAKNGANTRTVTVKVTDDKNGHLVANVTDGNNPFTFTNTYSATGSVTFEGTKTFDTRAVGEGDTFTFGVYEVIDGTERPIKEVKNNAQGKIQYPTINYTLADVGTHTYKVRETSESKDGVTVATTEHTVTVEVKDSKSHNGELDVVPSENYQSLDFQNKYEASGTLTIEGTKELTGRDLVAGEFQFKIKEDDTVVATGTNDADGKITFTDIKYRLGTYKDDSGNTVEVKDTGNHHYVVTEDESTLAGVQKNDQSFAFDVEVTDNKDGSLKIEPTGEYNKINFVNTFESSASVTIAARKTLNGKAPAEGQFQFTLTGDKVANGSETVKNGENGVATFSDLTFTQADVGRTFEYEISEVQGTDPLVTYDKSVKKATVKVELVNNKVVANRYYENNEAPAFANTSKATFELNGTKTLENRDFKQGETITFKVEGSEGAPMPENDTVSISPKSGRSAKFTFGEVTVGADNIGQTYTYTVTEEAGLSGVTNDTRAHTVTVTVGEDEHGNITVEKSFSEAALDFVNTYGAEGSIELGARKNLNGEPAAGYTFALYSGTDVAEDAAPLQTATSGSDGAVAFQGISYELGQLTQTNGDGYKYDTFAYTIREVIPAGATRQGNGTYKLNGYTYDGHSEVVTVTVTDDGAGELKAEANRRSDQIVFNNTYEAKGDITFSGTKTLENRPLTNSDTFNFAIAENDKVVATATSAGNAITYPKLEYVLNENTKETGTHTYDVYETATDVAGVQISNKHYTVTVDVKDNGDGTLEVTRTDTSGSLNFVNTYQATGSVDLEVKKELAGATLEEGAFQFQLYAATKNADGTYTKGAAIGGLVSNDADGKVKFPLEYNQNVISYGEDSGKSDNAHFKKFYYIVQEYVPETATHLEGTKYALGNVIYDAAEQPFEVTVTNYDSSDGTFREELKVTIGNGLEDIATITNEQVNNGTIAFSAKKVLKGGNLSQYGPFTFQLKDSDGNVIDEKATNESGIATFEEISYSAKDVGKTFIYTISEVDGSKSGITYDDHTETVTVKVTKSDGQIVATPTPNTTTFEFTNSYKAEGDATFFASKTLENKTLQDNMFSFTLTGPKIADGSETVYNNRERAEFTPIHFTQDDLWDEESQSYLDSKNFDYTIEEVAGKEAGVTYATAEKQVQLRVTDNHDGSLSFAYNNGNELTGTDFVNTYGAKGSIELGARKNLNGEPAAGYTFALYGGTDVAEDAVPLQTATSGSDGVVAFQSISYDLGQLTETNEQGFKTGTFTYTIKEVIPEGAEEQADDTWKLNGYTYDGKSEVVTVTVADDGTGELKATADRKSDQIVFANTYEATGQAELFATKTLNGTAPADRTFSFELKDAEGNVLQNTESSTQGSVVFDPISYDLDGVGDYTYTISEDIPADAARVNDVWTKQGVSYDSHVETVTVHVRDAGDGTLRVTYGDGEDAAEVFGGAEFANTYAAEADYEIAGTKVLDGRQFHDGDSMTFHVTAQEVDADGEAVEGAATPATPADITLTPTEGNQASITFAPVHYTLADAGKTYRYTVTETINSGVNVVPEQKVHTVTVSIRDNGNGTLAVKDKYSDGSQLNFVNTYTATGELVLSGTKTLEGRELGEGDVFTFQLSRDGEVIASDITNDANGVINYPKLQFGLKDVGEHTYSVKEATKNGNGITVDEKTYTFVVNVSDSGYGFLNIDVTGDNPKALNFTNTYEAKAELPLVGTKTLEGRELTQDDVFAFAIYEIKDVDGEEQEELVGEAQNDKTGKINYPTLSYVRNAKRNDTGTHEYVVREKSESADGITVDENEYRFTVTVTDEKTGELTVETDATHEALNFTNTYEAKGSVDIEATKTLNRRWKKGEEFTFVLSGGKLGKGTATAFTQEVEAEAAEEEAANAGETQDNSDSNVANASVNTEVRHVATFSHDAIDALNFTQDDMKVDKNGKKIPTTYTYSLREQLPEGVKVDNPTDESTGITYDTSIYTVEVTIQSDDGKGNLTVTKVYKDAAGKELDAIEFANTYQAKSISTDWTATKQFNIVTNTDAELERGQFQFILCDNHGSILQTRTNGVYVDEQGNESDIDVNVIRFTPITYYAVGVYVYTIQEVVPNNATNADGIAYKDATEAQREAGGFKLNGIEYDSTVYYSQVAVTDKRLTGQLEIQRIYNNDESNPAPTFTNNYFESQAQAHFNKAYYGTDTNAAFKFIMAPADEDFNVNTADSSVMNLTNGTFENNVAEVVSDTISYYEPGTYRYVIWEATESSDALTTDTARILVTITVGNDAQATVEYAVDAGGTITKIAEDDLPELYNNGFVSMAFRSRALRVGAESVRLASFEPEVQKVLKNGVLFGDDFRFSIYAGDTVSGDPMQTVSNDVNGKVAFDAIMFGEENIGKTYTYTIVEQATTDQTIITDKRAITLTIKVSEGSDGEIVLDAEYAQANDEGNVEVTDTPTFVNEYDTIVIHAVKRSREEPYDPLPGAHYGLWMVNPKGEDVYMGLGRNQLEEEGSELVSSDNGDLYYDIPLLEGVAYYFLEEWPPPAGHLVDPYPTDYFTLVHDKENGKFRLVYEADDDFSKYCPGITR